MKQGCETNKGIAILVDRLREEFRCAENINYYTQDSYKEAEKRYIKFRLSKGA